MQKKILITGSTDGIGLETAKSLTMAGHHVVLHGRNQQKLDKACGELERLGGNGNVSSLACDLSNIPDVSAFVEEVAEQHSDLDILINNAGIFATGEPITAQGLDVRFVVNTIAPYMLTRRLVSVVGSTGRIVNLSSAAQAPVEIAALEGIRHLSSDGAAYAQSKLALTMWSAALGTETKEEGPVIVAVNPASFLGSKMVKDAYGMAGKDLSIGVDILVRASLSDEFANASGKYFDNDAGRFAPPHPSALDRAACQKIVTSIDAIIEKHG